jgi:hypothetical protein
MQIWGQPNARTATVAVELAYHPQADAINRSCESVRAGRVENAYEPSTSVQL